MTRIELKARAREQLGGKIFGNIWLIAVLAVFIYGVITGAVSNIIPGLGALILIGPMTYGMKKMFLKQSRDHREMELGELFNGFTDDFGQTLLIGLLTSLFTFLWGLLFIIPGIVKYYAYSMAYYIKADHPDYDWRQCIDESKAMMNGHKWELFVLELSFLGWGIVGALCLGIGTLWVSAYMEAARAQFYESIKQYVLPE